VENSLVPKDSFSLKIPQWRISPTDLSTKNFNPFGGGRGILHGRNFSRRNFHGDEIFYGKKRQICQHYLKNDLIEKRFFSLN